MPKAVPQVGKSLNENHPKRIACLGLLDSFWVVERSALLVRSSVAGWPGPGVEGWGYCWAGGNGEVALSVGLFL